MKEYADAIINRLPAEVFRPVPGRILLLPVYSALVAACTVAIVNGHLGIASRLGLAALIGLAYSWLGILGHEVMHGSVVEPLWLRRCLGGLCVAPLGIGPVFWTLWHNIHHAHTQDAARDPDIFGTLDSIPLDRTMGFLRRFTHPRTPLFPFLLAAGVTAHAAVLLFCMQKLMTVRQRLATLSELAVLWAFWLGLGSWLGWLNFLFFFAIPLVVSNAIVNSFVITNHFLNPMDSSGDVLATSLTVTAYPWVERLFLNFNYHTEHHLFPRMSPKYAPRVARLLEENWPDRYHTLPHLRAFLAVWRTPRVYYDSVHLIDTRNQSLYGTLGHGLEDGRSDPDGQNRKSACAS